MKIQAVDSYKYSTAQSVKTSQKPIEYGLMRISGDSVSFQGVKWDSRKINILERSAAALKDLATYFNKSGDDELRAVSCEKNIFGKIKVKKSEKAYNRLKDAVDEVKGEREVIETALKLLREKRRYKDLSSTEKALLKKYERKIADLDKRYELREQQFSLPEN